MFIWFQVYKHAALKKLHLYPTTMARKSMCTLFCSYWSDVHLSHKNRQTQCAQANNSQTVIITGWASFGTNNLRQAPAVAVDETCSMFWMNDWPPFQQSSFSSAIFLHVYRSFLQHLCWVKVWALTGLIQCIFFVCLFLFYMFVFLCCPVTVCLWSVEYHKCLRSLFNPFQIYANQQLVLFMVET